MTVLVEFDVIGVPAPQGSKKAFVANGRAMMKEASGGHAAWRNAVSDKAREVADGLPWGGPLDGALALSVVFRFPLPSSRKKADRERGWCPKVSMPDTDKLVRLIGDSLTAAGLVIDDARFHTVHARKIETLGWTGAHITITREDAADTIANTRGAA